MFKNYLTHQFALGFERACFEVPLSNPEKQELTRCATQMVRHLERAIRAEKPSQKCPQLFVALTYLADCQDLLGSRLNGALAAKFQVLQARLEQLCLQSADEEGGQLRMMG